MERTLYFDMDGTLVDQSERFYQVYREILLELGGAPLEKRKHWKLRRRRASTRNILQQSGDEELYDPFIEKRNQRIEADEFLRLDRPFSRVPEILSELARSYSCNLISLRDSREGLERQLWELGWSSLFDRILTASAFGTSEDKYLLLKKEGVREGRDLIVGDTETDIEAGHKAQMITAAVTCGMREKELLEKAAPHFIGDDLEALYSKEGVF